jgi:hypothetical protein
MENHNMMSHPEHKLNHVSMKICTGIVPIVYDGDEGDDVERKI